MSILIHLGQDGAYTKNVGEPLQPQQVVMLYNGMFALPNYFEELVGDQMVCRSWRIPIRGGHYLLREFLPRRDYRGWPWV